MSQPNHNWARWCIASLAVYFQDNVATPLSLPFLVEGIDDRTPDFEQSPDRAELRVNGPFTRELSKNCWEIGIDVNILVTSNMDGTSKFRYSLEDHAGQFHRWADTCIPVYRLGNLSQDSENDGSLLGVLRPRHGNRDSVDQHNFGQINSTTRIKQSQVDARYLMTL